jgi:protein required for attachment to host cells
MTGIKIPHDAWILVGDGKKAMILRNKGDQVHPHLVLDHRIEQENTVSGQAEANAVVDVDTSGRRTVVEKTDGHQLDETRFAKKLADQLYKTAHSQAFDNLIVVAPPRILGVLREAFHPEVRNRILAEIDKTLTQHPVPEIERILTEG